MIPHFVHIGDAHQNGRPERWRPIEQILGENLDLPTLAAWLIPGDLNHARMTIEDRNLWARSLRWMATKAPVVLCYGNHDVSGDLDVFSKLKALWPIYVVAKPEVIVVPLATGQTASIFVLPYPTESGLVSAGLAAGAVAGAARQALDAIFMDAGAKLAAARSEGHITLAIGHVNVAGAITATGQPNIGHEIELDQALIARLGDECYVGLNHIHKAQQIAGAYYPGSTCRLDWGEVDAKGYLRVVYAEDGNGFDVVTCPIDVPPMYHVEGWLARDGFTYEVKKGPDGAVAEKPESWRGAEVRVRARFHQSEKGILEFAKAHVFAEFAEAKRLELEPVAVPDGALRAPEVAAARTLAEKVAAWAVETHVVLPEDVLAVLPLLEHGDTETVIAGERDLLEMLLDPPVLDESEVAVA